MHKKPAFWFHALVSALIIGTMFGLASFVFLQAQKGVCAWWVYPAFALFIGAVFTADWFICREEKTPE